MEFWHDQVQTAHSDLEDVTKSHAELVGPVSVPKQPEDKGDECKELYKETEAQLDKTIAETDDVSSLSQQGPALVAALGSVRDKLLAKRLAKAQERAELDQ